MEVATLPAVSQQLRVLRRADLIRERREGRQRYYRLNPEPLKEVRDWMRMYEKFWTKKLRRLGPGFVITRFHHPDGEPADFATSAVHATALMGATAGSESTP